MRLPRLLALGMTIVVLTSAHVCMAENRALHGRVVKLGSGDEPTSATGLTVILLETGDSSVTVDGGLFRIPPSESLPPGTRITLATSATDWRVFHPNEGEIHVPASPTELVTIELLPVGSLRFLSDQSLEKLVRNSMRSDTSRVFRSSEARVPGSQLVAHGSVPNDLERSLREWAADHELSLEQVERALRRWTKSVAAQSDSYSQALAAYVEHNFARANDLSNKAVDENLARLEELDRQEEEIHAEEHRTLQRVLDSLELLVRTNPEPAILRQGLWTFFGVRKSIQDAPALRQDAAWLDGLLEALEGTDMNRMRSELRVAKERVGSVPQLGRL